METVEGNFQIQRTDLQATLTLRFAVVGAQICHRSDNQIWSYFFHHLYLKIVILKL